MFPPELDHLAGEIGRVRRVGRDGRPLSLIVAVVLLAVFWVVAAGVAVWGLTRQYERGEGWALAGVAFWTLMVAVLLWRVWRGGPTAIRFAAGMGTATGGATLAGTVAFGVLMEAMPDNGAAPVSPLGFLPGVCSGGVLIAAGLLLRRREVREWGGVDRR